VRPARFERATLCLEGRCSIQLSYGRNLSDKNYYARSDVCGKSAISFKETKLTEENELLRAPNISSGKIVATICQKFAIGFGRKIK
jgi:hypothetical protein